MPKDELAKKIERLKDRVAKLAKINQLVKALPELTERRWKALVNLEERLTEEATKGHLKQARAALDRTDQGLKRLRKSAPGMKAAGHKLDELLIQHPERITENLDDRSIDRMLDRALTNLELQDALLGAEIEELNEITIEIEHVLGGA